MANTRSSKPLYFYEVALDLVILIECASESKQVNEDLRKTLTNVLNDYVSGTTRWSSLADWFRWYKRTRVPDIKRAIDKLTPANVEFVEGDEISLETGAIDIILELLKDDAGWGPTSVNGNVLKRLLLQLPNYGKDKIIHEEDFKEFKDILIIANDVKKKMQAELEDKKSQEEQVAKLQKAKEDEILLVQQEASKQQHKLSQLEEELEHKEAELAIKDAKIMILEAQKNELDKQIETLKLHPELKFAENNVVIKIDTQLKSALVKLSPKQIEELEKTLRVTAVTFAAEETGSVQRKKDLVQASSSGIVSKLKEQFATHLITPEKISKAPEIKILSAAEEAEVKSARENVKVRLMEIFQNKFGKLNPDLVKNGYIATKETGKLKLIESYVGVNENFKTARMAMNTLFKPRANEVAVRDVTPPVEVVPNNNLAAKIKMD